MTNETSHFTGSSQTCNLPWIKNGADVNAVGDASRSAFHVAEDGHVDSK